MRILIILLLVFTAYSKEFINTQLILNVEKKYNRFAKNRFNALNRLLKRLEKKDELTKLQEVNDFFNSVSYGEDIDIYKVNDYWATPFEFLAKDKGDCEDYVIAKYLVLKYLGVSSEKMFLTYVRVEDLDRAHMVLSYYKTSTSEPLILDSIRRIIFPASKRKDLKPIYNFNPNILKNGKKTSAHKKWDNLIKNFRENKI
jgi:predicted transglutaminase-like cysteine proteinase